jgi:hypothetical protein
MRHPNLRIIPLHSIDMNIIGDEGAAAIGESLKQNKALATLE